jgi:flagellar hook-basal body complex protein FliE
MISALAAAKAYAATQGSATPALGGAAAPAAGPNFGDMVKNSISEMMETSKAAEKQIVAQVQGKAELVDVVTALSAAETSMETVMAVRDQVISAYQEIMRMPI